MARPAGLTPMVEPLLFDCHVPSELGQFGIVFDLVYRRVR